MPYGTRASGKFGFARATRAGVDRLRKDLFVSGINLFEDRRPGVPQRGGARSLRHARMQSGMRAQVHQRVDEIFEVAGDISVVSLLDEKLRTAALADNHGNTRSHRLQNHIAERIGLRTAEHEGVHICVGFGKAALPSNARQAWLARKFSMSRLAASEPLPTMRSDSP